MEANFSLLFFLKRKTNTDKKQSAVYLRVTIKGTRFETSIHRQVDTDKWITKVQKVKGNTEESKGLNDYIDLMRNRAFNIQREILLEGGELTSSSFKNKWLGVSEKSVMLLDVFLEHNRKMKELVGKEFAQLTYVRYETTLEHTRKFPKWKFKINDIDLRKINFEFVSDMSFWLKSVRNCNHSGWIDRNPFLGFKMVKKEVIREFLSNEDLEKMTAATFPSERSSCYETYFCFAAILAWPTLTSKSCGRQKLELGSMGANGY